MPVIGQQKGFLMKEALRRRRSIVAVRQEGAPRKMRFSTACCSICTRRIWLDPSYLTEPEGVPEPRLSWVLCKRCYQALTDEMRRSPVLSPLRLRIAMGMVASDYWPHAYPTSVRAYISDRKWVVFIAASFVVAMLLHLALIVMIAALK
jgi:hypothetical protein